MNEEFSCYQAQLKAVEQIESHFTKERFVCLAGETGVGKTYIAVQVIYNLLEKRPDKKVLVIAPVQVRQKFQRLLAMKGLKDIQVVTRFTNETLKEYDLIVYDELHTMKTKVKHFYNLPKRIRVLGMTGSLIDKNPEDVTEMFRVFMREFSRNIKTRQELGIPIISYIQDYLIPLLCVSLSKEEVKEIETTQLKVMPSQYQVSMTEEEEAFYNFFQQRATKDLEIGNDRAIRVLNQWLDREKNISSFLRVKGKDYFIGHQLHEFEDKKAQAIQKIFTINPNMEKRTIIYTLSDSIAKRVANTMKLPYIKTSSQDETLLAKLNDLLKTSAVVVNIQPILTGVDIHADTIIWYQTPVSLSQDIQGVGRISRLSSKGNKRVIYLYSKNTIQETMVNKLADYHQMNNMAIKQNVLGNKTHNNLLQLFGNYHSLSGTILLDKTGKMTTVQLTSDKGKMTIPLKDLQLIEVLFTEGKAKLYFPRIEQGVFGRFIDIHFLSDLGRNGWYKKISHLV